MCFSSSCSGGADEFRVDDQTWAADRGGDIRRTVRVDSADVVSDPVRRQTKDLLAGDVIWPGHRGPRLRAAMSAKPHTNFSIKN